MHEIIKRGDTIIKIDSSNKNENWYHFMKTYYIGSWERYTFSIIDRFIDKFNKVFIDIGAWVGPITLYYAEKFKWIYAVEPDKESVRILKKNIELNNFNSVTIIDKAIYSENKSIYLGPNEYYHSKEMNISVSQSRELKLYDSDYKVEGITFGELIRQYQINNIGIIKCDIEGGEENIISDLLTYTFNNNIPALISFHYNWWKKHKLEYFIDTFGLFYHPNCIIEDIKQNPFKSILFYRNDK